MSYGAYKCNVLDHRDGQALIEETKPVNAVLLPHYVMSLENYSERECRCLSREIARRLHLFHGKGNVVHRKLHLENVLVESHVSSLHWENRHWDMPCFVLFSNLVCTTPCVSDRAHRFQR